EGNKGCRDQKLVCNWVEQNPQGCHLFPAARVESIGPIGSCREQQDQDAPDRKVHGDTQENNVWLARKHHYTQKRYEKDAKDREAVWKVHGAPRPSTSDGRVNPV